MFRQGPIPAFVHGVLEYAAGVFLVASSFLFGFDSGGATAVSIVAGVLIMVIAASSAMPTGLIKSIPVHAHVVLDYILSGLLIASPFIFSFTQDGTATAVFIVLGIVYLLMTIATRFVRDKPAPAELPKRKDPEPGAPKPARESSAPSAPSSERPAPPRER